MARAIVLTCPVCGASHALAGDRDRHGKGELLDAVADHLDAHGLSESVRAIRKHEAVSHAEERILDADALDALPTVGWVTMPDSAAVA